MPEVEEERGESASQTATRRPRARSSSRRTRRWRRPGDEHEPEDTGPTAVLPSPDDERDNGLEDAAALAKPQGAQYESAVNAVTLAARWTTGRGQWVILACIPRVAHRLPFTLFPFIADHYNRVAAAPPPRASLLTVHHHFSPDRKTLYNFPYIAGANRSCLLLCASKGTDPEPLKLDRFTSEQLGHDHSANMAYFLFRRSTTNRDVFRLPDRPFHNPGNACLGDDGDNHDVFELLTNVMTANAVLICYSPERSSQWSGRILSYPPHYDLHRHWGAHGTIYHNCKIWWVDLSYGLLYGDAHATLRGAGELSFVALPDGCALPAGTPDLDKRRCVGVSAGALRYVQIHNLRGRNDKPVPVVSMWTLIDEATGEWRRDCRTPFQWIWDDVGYKATKLRPDHEVPAVAFIHPNHGDDVGSKSTKLRPEPKVPAVAFIHPDHGDVVYFFQQSRIIGVDVRVGKVVEWQYFAMLHPPMQYQSSRFVRPWLVTPELLADWAAPPKPLTIFPSTSNEDKGSPKGSGPSNIYQG